MLKECDGMYWVRLVSGRAKVKKRKKGKRKEKGDWPKRTGGNQFLERRVLSLLPLVYIVSIVKTIYQIIFKWCCSWTIRLLGIYISIVSYRLKGVVPSLRLLRLPVNLVFFKEVNGWTLLVILVDRYVPCLHEKERKRAPVQGVLVFFFLHCLETRCEHLWAR